MSNGTTVFPGSLDSNAARTNADEITSTDHNDSSVQIEAIEGKVGIGPSNQSPVAAKVLGGDSSGHSSWRKVTSADVTAYDKARVTKSTNQSITTTTETTVSWDQEDFDTNALHDNSTNNERLTAKVAGTYLISANLNIQGHADNGNRYISIVVNGGTAIATVEVEANGSTADNIALSTTTIYQLGVGDYVTATVEQESGGSLNVLAARSHFEMTLLP